MLSGEQVARVPAHWGHAGMSAAVAAPHTVEGAEASVLDLGTCLDFTARESGPGVKGEPGLGA